MHASTCDGDEECETSKNNALRRHTDKKKNCDPFGVVVYTRIHTHTYKYI